METPIRNIAIIAHVDHGKTTLVDHILRQSGTFGSHEHVEERYMDSMDLEKERGITIAAKNASFVYKGVKVNIVDTPGHSDFGGEVERILDMVDGAILLVDASEGPLPQTRFVLQKALQQNLKVMVCVNKIDRPDARIKEVVDEVFSLFVDLDANDEQAEFTTIFTVARDGIAVMDPDKLSEGKDLRPLLDYIVDHFPPPKVDHEGSLQLLVANLGYNDYVGRLAVGRVRSGKIKVGDEVLIAHEKSNEKFKVTALFAFKASEQVAVQEVTAGDIGVVAGLKEISIGDTLTSVTDPRPLPRLRVDEPTVGILVSVNNSPLAGKEGKMVTSRNIKERLERERLVNVAIRVEDTKDADTWKVLGRGELQLGVMLEQMRREGFEVLVSKPTVIFREEGGHKLEPMELAVVDVAESFTGVVAQKMGERKGIMSHMENKGSGRVRMTFRIPARGLIGYRSEFLTDTRGTGLLNTQFEGYESYKGPIQARVTGRLVSDRSGKSTAYALWKLEERGRMFIQAGDTVYEGMVVGDYNKAGEIMVNVTREKQLTNVRTTSADEAIRLTPVKPKTLEEAMEWISDEELVEVTPKSIRIRCRELDQNKRKR
ncbi:MAG: translational GTPase TypA [Deltaproteobacteria bacterium]|nr:translational GTPase TypA [Deltaproteobacteria bacterium]